MVLAMALCSVLSTLAFYKRVLTWDGSVAAFVVGFTIRSEERRVGKECRL